MYWQKRRISSPPGSCNSGAWTPSRADSDYRVVVEADIGRYYDRVAVDPAVYCRRVRAVDYSQLLREVVELRGCGH